MIRTYVFKVKAIDENSYKPYTIQGILVASSFTEATDQIEQSFKDSLISIENLTLKDDSCLIFFAARGSRRLYEYRLSNIRLFKGGEII